MNIRYRVLKPYKHQHRIKKDKEPKWNFDKAEKMEKPWEYWDNGYTRFRRLQWEIEHNE